MDSENTSAAVNADNVDSFDEYIKEQKKKYAKKKRMVISIASGAAALVVIIIAIIVTNNIITENNKKKAMEEVTADVADIAEKYNIDLTCIDGSKNNHVAFNSEAFAKLSANEMNSVFMAFEDEKDYKVGWGYVEILSQGLRYKVNNINAGYKTISDYSKYGNGSEYDNITSKISYETGDHILELDDINMTCNILRRYKYDYSNSSSNSSSKSSNSSSSGNSSGTKKGACSGGFVSCREGFHPCGEQSNGYCNSCCADPGYNRYD